jgi:hypothetical protein
VSGARRPPSQKRVRSAPKIWLVLSGIWTALCVVQVFVAYLESRNTEPGPGRLFADVRLPESLALDAEPGFDFHTRAGRGELEG